MKQLLSMSQIVKILKSIEFWTITAAIATILSFVVSLRGCESSPKATLQFRGSEMEDGNNDITIYYICTPNHDIIKYELPFPIVLVNNSSVTIPNLSFRITCKMKSIGATAFMKRFLYVEDQNDNYNEVIDPPVCNIVPHTAINLLSYINVVNDKNIKSGVFDDFWINMSLVYEGIDAAIVKKIHIVTILSDYYGNWAELVTRAREELDDNCPENYVVMTTNDRVITYENKILSNHCDYKEQNAFKKLSAKFWVNHQYVME